MYIVETSSIHIFQYVKLYLTNCFYFNQNEDPSEEYPERPTQDESD